MGLNIWVARRDIALGVVVCACLCACGSVTPSQTYLRAADLRGIHSVAAYATSAAVSVSYAHGQGLPNPLQGWVPDFSPLYQLVHDLVELHRAGEDQAHAASIQRHVGSAEVEAVLLQAFTDELRKAPTLTSVTAASGPLPTDAAQRADATIQLRVNTIGLQRAAGEELRLEVSIHAQMERKNGTTLWSRDDRAQSRRTYPLAYYQEHGVQELESLLRQIGTRLAGELVYAF
jgi:hypothetical protein